jgi:hypothetical protein
MEAKEIQMIANFIKLARHTRNYNLPPENGITAGQLRSEAVQAEVFAEQLLGKKVMEKVYKIAFEE